MNRKYIELKNLKEYSLNNIKIKLSSLNNLNNLKDEESMSGCNGNEKHRELTERLNEVVVEVNTDGKIIYANKKALEKTGYTKEEIEKGINISQLVDPKDKFKVVTNFNRLLKGEKLTRSVYNIKRKDGSTFPVVTYPDYILDNKGKIVK